MTDDSSEIVKWLGIRLRVPKGWEIVRHSLNLEKGSLVFVDRRRETLRLYWRDCARAPDLNRMLEDQRSKMALEAPGANIAELQGIGRFRGFVREQGEGERVVHAAIFDSRSMRLVEVILSETGDEASGKSLRARVLGNLEVASKAELARDFWAFGLRVAVPSGFRLSNIDVKPADVKLDFDEIIEDQVRPSGASATLRRMGMAASWAPADKSQLLARQLPTLTLKEPSEERRFGHAAYLARGKEVHPRLLNWLGLGRQGQALLWHCGAHNAIYSVSMVFPKRRPIALDAFSMACCGGSDA